MVPSSTSRWLVIVNPASNRGATAECVGGIKRILDEHRIAFDLVMTQRKNHAFDITAEKAAQYRLIAAVGGDGTVHEIINGVLFERKKNNRPASGPVIGIIPSGSGNDFVKVLKIPADLYRAVQIILEGRTQTVDIGSVAIDGEERGYFHNNVGAGFDAHVNYENGRIRALRGLAGYLSAVVKTVFRYRHPQATIHWNGGDMKQKVLLINTGNGRSSGGGFFLTPEAELDDGLFDVCVIESIGKMRIFKELPKALDGSHTKLKEVRMFRTDALVIESEHGLPVHADGEMLALNAKTIRLGMIPEKITVFRAS